MSERIEEIEENDAENFSHFESTDFQNEEPPPLLLLPDITLFLFYFLWLLPSAIALLDRIIKKKEKEEKKFTENLSHFESTNSRNEEFSRHNSPLIPFRNFYPVE